MLMERSLQAALFLKPVTRFLTVMKVSMENLGALG